jgi:vacuolar iron transporter family protein
MQSPQHDVHFVQQTSYFTMAKRHNTHSRYLHDFVLGFADGLTVPFALTVGFASLGSQKLVVTAGLAELLSGALSMGLGQYLAALTDRQHYQNELRREKSEIENEPMQEREEVYEILCKYGPSREEARPFVEALCLNEGRWVQVRESVVGALVGVDSDSS